MPTSKPLLATLASLLLLSPALAAQPANTKLPAQEIWNPDIDYMEKSRLQPHDKLLLLVTDLNLDGRNQVLTSLTHQTNGANGHVWQVYIQQLDGSYKIAKIHAGHPVQFPIDSYYVGPVQGIKGVKGIVLAGYAPTAPDSGMLIFYQFKNNAVHVVYNKLIHPHGAERQLYYRLFRRTPWPAIQQRRIPWKYFH